MGNPDADAADRAGDRTGDPWIGALLGGKYRVLSRLARGGMGTAYEARHLLLERLFAIKILHAEYASRPRMVRRFLQEAKASGALASEHVVAVYDYGEAWGTPYLVMERLRGDDLQRLLASTGPLTVARAVGIALDVCRGLAAAHTAGLVHRDLKPANVFVLRSHGGKEHAKLLDFGVAKLKGEARMTGEHALLGTIGYMAPEQVLCGARVDNRVDIHAVGLLLHEMLNGAPLRRGDEAAVLLDIVMGNSTALDPVRQDLPPGLAAVIARALAREPQDRYSNALELAAALQPFATTHTLLDTASRVRHGAALGDPLHNSTKPDSSVAESPPASQALVTRTRSGERLLAARIGLLLLGAFVVWMYVLDSRLRPSRTLRYGERTHEDRASARVGPGQPAVPTARAAAPAQSPLPATPSPSPSAETILPPSPAPCVPARVTSLANGEPMARDTLEFAGSRRDLDEL